MTDVFLCSGELSPNDIRLRDPTMPCGPAPPAGTTPFRMLMGVGLSVILALLTGQMFHVR